MGPHLDVVNILFCFFYLIVFGTWLFASERSIEIYVYLFLGNRFILTFKVDDDFEWWLSVEHGNLAIEWQTSEQVSFESLTGLDYEAAVFIADHSGEFHGFSADDGIGEFQIEGVFSRLIASLEKAPLFLLIGGLGHTLAIECLIYG